MGERKLEQFSWNWSSVTNNKYFCLCFLRWLLCVLVYYNAKIKCFFFSVANLSRLFICCVMMFFFLKFLRKNFSLKWRYLCAIPQWHIMRGTYWLCQISNKTNIVFRKFSNKRNRSNLLVWTNIPTNIWFMRISTSFCH